MRILIFAGGFFPGQTFGGPPVSIDNFCSLMKDFECYIVTSDHDSDSSERYSGICAGWNDRENAKVLYLSDKEYFSLKVLKKIVKEIKPDWIYLQSLFQDLTLFGLILSKKYKIKTLLAPRGELCAGAFKKKYKKIPYIWFLKKTGLLKNIQYQSTSDEETEAIRIYLKASDNNIHYLTNIPSIPKRNYERNLKRRGIARFIFLSRIHPKKNLISAIQYLNGVSGDVVFDIYGPLEDKDYWDECKREMQSLSSNVKVRYCGLVTHEDVHKTFSNYDAFIFPTLSENYGHVIAESLVVGTPVVLNKGATPWDDINGVAGFVADLDNKKSFTEYLDEIVQMDKSTYSELTASTLVYINSKLQLGNFKKSYEEVFMEN